VKTIGRWLAEHWIALGSPIVSLIVWEWASATGVLREAFFPRPSTVLAHLVQLAADGTLWAHTARSLVRIGWAFALAAVFGVGIGLAMGLWRRLRDGLDPVFAVIYPIPSVLFLPLVSFMVGASSGALLTRTIGLASIAVPTLAVGAFTVIVWRATRAASVRSVAAAAVRSSVAPFDPALVPAPHRDAIESEPRGYSGTRLIAARPQADVPRPSQGRRSTRRLASR